MIKIINITSILFLFILNVFSTKIEETKNSNNLNFIPEIEQTLNNEITNQNKEIYNLFKENIYENPKEAQRLFLELINGMSEDKKKEFLDKNYNNIANLLIELFKIDPLKTYVELVQELKNNGIEIRGDLFQKSPKSTKFQSKIFENPINKIIDVKNRIISAKTEGEVDTEINSLSVSYSTNSSVQTSVAEIYNEIKKYDKAQYFSTKAIELDQANTDAYKLRAVARYSMNDVKGAIEDIRKASEIDPQDETNKLLTALIESKKQIETKDISSLKSLKNALIDTSEEKSVVLSAKINDSNTNIKESSIDYTKSDLYLKTAITKNQIGDYINAIKYTNLAIEKNPENYEAYLERANSNNFLGNYDEAIKDLTFVINKEPKNIIALNMRAYALYKKGDYERTQEDTSLVLNIKPDYADSMFTRALSYEKQGKYDEMIKDLRKASLINPSYKKRFQDALAQYFDKENKKIENVVKEEQNYYNKKENKKYKNFFTLLLFTISGGLLIGLGLLHIFSDKESEQAKITHPNEIIPSIFYEGVATGKYKIIKRIGQGGMGSVYLAVDQSLNREVAIKKMNEDLKLNDKEKQRFLEEARTVAMLHNPNIIEIYTIFEENGDIYLVFEYLDGETLDIKLDREVRFPFFEVKEIVNEVGKALSYAHKKNLIHRDLKLSNIMVSKDGLIKVMDFGLAKILRQSFGKNTKIGQEIVGSPAYMAPEQEEGGSVKESDIYSLGICIYEMLNGELPFKGPIYHFQKLKKEFIPLSVSVPGLDERIDSIVNKILDPIPENRYRTIEDFLLDFNKLE